MSAENWVRVAGTKDVPEGTAFPVEIKGKQLAVYHVEGGGFHCTDNVCSHAYALLTDGWLEGCMIECPLHAGQFDVRTGKGQGAPIEEDIAAYECRAEGPDIFVKLP